MKRFLLISLVSLGMGTSVTAKTVSRIPADIAARTAQPVLGSCVYFEDFTGGPAGWTPIDLAAQDSYWSLSPYTDVNLGPVAVWWCGQNDPSWATPPGYGTDWRQTLTKEFTLGAPGSLEYQIQYDTEPGYDFVYVEISTDNGTSYTTLSSYDGASGGIVSASNDLSAYAFQTVLIRFRFVSDLAYDDQDGNADSDGGCRIYSVTVDNVLDTFEVDGQGWVPSGDPGLGFAYRLEESGECLYWAAHDPNTLMFPILPPGSPVFPQFGIESPIIPIPGYGTGYYLEFDVFADLDLNDGVFYRWYVSIDGGDWVHNNSVYYKQTGWTRDQYDITSYVGPGATTAQIRLIGTQLLAYMYYTGSSGAGPWFDNVAITATGTGDPEVGCVIPESVCEGPVPVFLQDFRSDWAGDHVVVLWSLVGVEDELTFSISRREGSSGLYQTIPNAKVLESSRDFRYEDHTTEPDKTYGYRVVMSEGGAEVASFEVTATTPSLNLTLGQNRPNPFNPSTEIRFVNDRTGEVALAVYDVSGRLVRTLVNRSLPAGSYTEPWDGRDMNGRPVSSGVYFYRLTAGAKTLTRKAVLLK